MHLEPMGNAGLAGVCGERQRLGGTFCNNAVVAVFIIVQAFNIRRISGERQLGTVS
jgi:hypothetical protein